MVEPSQELKLAFDKSVSDARKLQHEYVTLEHLLFAICCIEEFENLLVGYGIDVSFLKSNLEHHETLPAPFPRPCGETPSASTLSCRRQNNKQQRSKQHELITTLNGQSGI